MRERLRGKLPSRWVLCVWSLLYTGQKFLTGKAGDGSCHDIDGHGTWGFSRVLVEIVVPGSSRRLHRQGPTNYLCKFAWF